MFWAVVSYFVTTLGTMATNYLTTADVTPMQGALISTAVGLAVVLIGVFIDRAKSAPVQLPPPQPGQQQQPQRRGMSLAAALALILVLCGAGGLGVTYGAQWLGSQAVAFFEAMSTPEWDKKADEPGVQRLASPVSKRNGVLTVTVTAVEVTGDVTKVTLTAKNTGAEEITMHTFQSCQLTVPGSASLMPDQAATSSRFSGVVPGEGEYTGTIIFDGSLAASVPKVTLSFSNIFSMSPSGPRSISLELPLNTNS